MDHSFFLLVFVTFLFVPIILAPVMFFMMTLAGIDVKDFIKFVLKSEK